MKFGDFLKAQRDEKKWTQPEAAEQIGIEQSYLSKLENSKAIPSAEIFDRLLSAYQFDMKAIGAQVSDAELEKLKDIVLVRDFIITTRKRSESGRRRWLIGGLMCLIAGSGLSTMGYLNKDSAVYHYIYESKGEIKPEESDYVYAELPSYVNFRKTMRRKDMFTDRLKKDPMFERLDYHQIESPVFLGTYYEQQSTENGLKRRYVNIDRRRISKGGYAGWLMTFGSMLIMGGLASFFISRRW